MWPLLVDMTKEESVQTLRNLELEAYSSLVTALRAQGALNQEKRKLLKETSLALNISSDRHKAEIRRAINDEKLNTIAYYISGHEATIEDWAYEGRRIVPLLPRVPPQTPYTMLAEEVAEVTHHSNKQLPLPSFTERKRSATIVQQQTVPPSENGSKSQQNLGNNIEGRKRKLSVNSENSALAQHLLTPKVSRIQQLYRLQSQMDENFMESGPNPDRESPSHIENHTTTNNTKNVGVKPVMTANKNTVLQNSASAIEPQKAVIVCPSKKTTTSTITNNINKQQKLVVVSNPPTLTTTSILQKTLSVPMNKITKLNLEKFKIVSNNSSVPQTVQVSVSGQTLGIQNKHKIVTLKAHPDKKIIPLSQLQMLNSKGGIKVVPLSGKIIGKNLTVTTTAPPFITKNITPSIVTYSKLQESAITVAPETNSSVEMHITRQIVANKMDTEELESRTDDKCKSAVNVIKEDVNGYDERLDHFIIHKGSPPKNASQPASGVPAQDDVSHLTTNLLDDATLNQAEALLDNAIISSDI